MKRIQVCLKFKQEQNEKQENIFKPITWITEKYLDECITGLEVKGQLNQKEFNCLDGSEFKEELIIETY